MAPEYLIRAGVNYRLVTDHLGSVRLVVNTTSGAIIQRLDYDAFGQVTLDTNPGFQPFGYAGGLYDPLTGLVRFGVRDYDPAIGRWLAKDPIGFQAGDSNLYAYVGNDPTNSVDPTGLLIWDVIDLLFFGQDIAAFVQCPGGGTAFRVILGGIGALPGIPSLGWLKVANAAGDVTGKLYHYTQADNAASIARNGLRSQSGSIYATTEGGLSAVQAQIDLALSPNRGLANAVFEIDTAALRQAGITPALGPRRVPGTATSAGGGTEVIFNERIPAQFIKRVK